MIAKNNHNRVLCLCQLGIDLRKVSKTIGNGMRGDRLRLLRENIGLTQADLAEQLDISEPQLWRYEHGESKARGDVVIKFATFFGVSSDYLLGLSDDPGVHLEGDLTPKERQAIAAWRNGKKFDAIKVITGDE